MTQVLARKWRPKTFSEVVGQEHVVRALSNALAQQRLHHAYLLTGTRGVGKTSLARIIAKALNCMHGITPTPCGICGACTEIDSGRFVDLVELDAASNTQVDNMRELLDGAVYAPTAGRYKVYIIDEVHMLSKSAFNAMLKTLEEPPEHVKFILATTDPQKIPVTVLSRCLQFNLKQIPLKEIAARLQQVLEQEHIVFEASALQLLARSAQGSMRDALSLLDQAIAYGAGKVELISVRSMLGSVDRGYLYTVLEALAARDGAALIEQADQMASRSLSFEVALQDLASLLHRLALAQTVPEAIEADDPDAQQLFELAHAFSPEDIQLFYQIALQGRGDMSAAPDEYAGFTMTLLRMLAFMPAASEVVDTVVVPAALPAKGQVKDQPKPVDTQNIAPKPTITRDNWHKLVGELKLGVGKMLAQNCEFKSQVGERIELSVPEAHKHLLQKAYQDKLQAALGAYIGKPVKLSFAVGESTGDTPVELANRETQAQQAQIAATMEQDPFVRDLVENFDARMVTAVIKPAQ